MVSGSGVTGLVVIQRKWERVDSGVGGLICRILHLPIGESYMGQYI